MKNTSYTRTIYFLCLEPTIIHPDIDLIAQKLRLTIPRISPIELMDAFQSHKHKILLLDYQTHRQITQQVQGLPLTNKNFETILINVEKRLTTDELLTFGCLKGVFYKNDDPKIIAQGLGEIINGQNWLPRKVSSQLLHYYRHMVHSHTTPVSVDLTLRELQILRCLQSGSSNTQIADDLFISEYTVKSHVYQIFKKLSVRNRVQAIAWANQNLLSC